MADTKEVKILINADASQAKDEVNSFSGSIKRMGEIAGGVVFSNLISKMASLGKTAIKAGFETASFYEQANIGLTTLLKSNEKARTVLEQIKKDALATPFNAEELVKGNQLLISAGVSADEARNHVLNLGNAVMATGGGNAELSRLLVNMQQIKAVGQASALDIKQFAFAGINMWQLLADATGKSVEELKNSKISYEDVTKALEKAAGAGGMFEGAIKNAGGSFAQLTSNMRENLATTAAAVVEQTGLYDLVKKSIAQLNDFVINNKQKVVDSIREQFAGVKDTLEAFKPSADAFILVFDNLFKAIGTLTGTLNEGNIALKVYATGLGVIAMSMTTIAGFADILILKIDQISQAVGMFLAKNAEDFFGHKQKLIQDQADIQKAYGDMALSLQTQTIGMNRIWDEHKQKVAEVAIQSVKTKDDYTTAFSSMKMKIDTDLPKMNETISTNMSAAAKNTMSSVGQMQSSHATAIEGMKTKTNTGFSDMHTNANTWWEKIKGIFDNITNGIAGAISSMNNSGISVGKKASGGYASGLTLVGERGAELVNLPSGSYVYNAESTKGMMGGVTVNFNNPTVRNDNDLQAIIAAVKQSLGRDNELAYLGAF